MKGRTTPGKDKPTFFFAMMTTVAVFYIKMIFLCYLCYLPLFAMIVRTIKDGKLEKNVYIQFFFAFIFFNQLELLRHNFEGAALVKM